MNKIKCFLVLIFMFSVFSFSVYADENKITDVEITTNEDGVIHFEGSTVGETTNLNLLVKIFNDIGELEYFNQISIKNNSFNFDATPLKAKNGATLTLKITGDLKFSKTFYYSSEYSSEIEENEEKVIDILKKYAIYYDDNSDYKMKFNIKYIEEDTENFVFLNGTNFVKNDILFTGKDAKTWEIFLKAIETKVKEISNKPTTIFVYDKNGGFIQRYPLIQSEVDTYITETKLQKLLSGVYYFKSNNNSYYFNYSLMNEGSKKYIKVKAIGDFTKSSTQWKDVKYSDVEDFANKIATLIRKEFNADIDVYFYDSNNTYLVSYSFYLYNEDQENEDDDDEIKFEFIPWDDTKMSGLVVMLRLMDYGTNYSEIKPIIKEGMTNDKYTYDMTVNSGQVTTALNSLRKDSQKIIVVKEEVDTNNISLKIDSSTINLLKTNKAMFIFDCNNYKVQLDFSQFTGSGEIYIKTLDIDMESEDYSKPISLSVELNNKDALSYFNNDIKCLIHYDSEKTRNVKDLRSINVFNSKDVMLNSVSTTKEKGFIFKYSGKDTYYAKNNSFNYKDIKDTEYKRYAELVSSKNIFKNITTDNFEPTKELTRGEFISYLSNKMGAVSNTNHFNDLKKSSEYYKEINGLYELGVLPSTYNGKIKSEEKIAVEEMIYITVRCYEVNKNNSEVIKSASLLYLDKNEISVWAKTKISVASKLKLIPDDGYLCPKDIGTRNDAVELIYKLLVAEGIF